MKTSWYIKNISNKRVQLLHLTYDDESKDLEIKDAETNLKIVFFLEMTVSKTFLISIVSGQPLRAASSTRYAFDCLFGGQYSCNAITHTPF